MRKWLRRMRGAIGIGVIWAMVWLGAGLVVLLIVGFGAADVPFPLFFGLLGFLAGVTFSAILGIVERRRRFDQMSLPRVAAWGGLGGILLSVGLAAIIGGEALPVLGPIFALSGAGCAAGSLAVARMAEDRELLDSGAKAGEAAPRDDETRELPRAGS